MNHVALIGRLTRDPEVRYSGDMAIARFSIAIDRPPKRDGSRETDFPSIVVFGKQAENCEKYIGKGRLVGIEGRIQTGSYTKQDGTKVYTTEVVANRVEFLDRGDRNDQAGFGQARPAAPQPTYDPAPAYEPAPQQAQPQQPQSSIPQGFEAIDDDDLPF